MEIWAIVIGFLALTITMFLVYFFTKSDRKSMFGKIPTHEEITGFSIKTTSLDNKNKYYIERYRDSS